jgi:hypothetical protein
MSEDNQEYPYLSFRDLRPEKVEITSLFPEYPKSLDRGYATVFEFDAKIVTKEFLEELRKSLQYSQSNIGGGGIKKDKAKPVEFFGGALMDYYVRTCGGCKSCEQLLDEIKSGHYNVEDDGHQWAQLLADQRRTEANTSQMRVEILWEQWKDERCPYNNISTGKPQCGGRTVIRSRNPDSGLNIFNRVFIGCSEYQHKEASRHMRQYLNHYNIVAVCKKWGRGHCAIHRDIFDQLGFSWDEEDKGMIFFYIFIFIVS